MFIRRTICFVLSIALVFPSLLIAGEPPVTRADNVIDTLHGVPIADPYRWLEDNESVEVKSWTDAQNKYFQDWVTQFPGREKLQKKMKHFLSFSTFGTPFQYGKFYFQTRRQAGQNHSVLFVTKGSGKPEVLLDPNTFSEDGTVALDWWYPSTDGAFVAFGKSSSGSERSTLYIINSETKELLADTIPYTRAASIAWVPNNRGFYYTRFATPGEVPEGDEDYYRRVYYHQIGGGWEDDPLVFGEGQDKAAWCSVALSPNGKHMIASVFLGWSKMYHYYKSLTDFSSEFIPLNENQEAAFDIIPLNDRFIIRTDQNAPRYRIMVGAYAHPTFQYWQELIPERESTIDEFIVAGNKIVTNSLTNAYSTVEVFSLEGTGRKEITLPALGSVHAIHGEIDSDLLYLNFSTFNMPTTIFSYNLTTGELKQIDQIEAGIDIDDIAVQQVWYSSKDSTKIPMFVIHRKGMPLDGNNPTYLYGYGGFNSNSTPFFSRTIGYFLSLGGVFAYPAIRGGGEFGEMWHKGGMLANKQNCFDDFISAGEYLIEKGYTSKERLVISGGSNGGLLIGAVVTQRPDLCVAAVCSVPLLDMIRYHKFLIAELWIPEYGSSDNADQFKYIYAYSPYHHVVNGVKYPSVLFKASESDGRVHPLHARKMTAIMQARTGSKNPIFLRLETKAGHGQGKPVSKRIEELVDTWSYIYDMLGVEIR